jgi:hypothetical protein
MKYSLTIISANTKTGPMPVTTSNRATCPDACPLKNQGCYADSFRTAQHWDAVSIGNRGKDWAAFIVDVTRLPKRIMWRHNIGGDLRGDNNIIDEQSLCELVKANKGKNGFTYTHYPLDNAVNISAVKQANEQGFTINASADNLTQADAYVALGIPTAVILPEDAGKVSYTQAGNKVVVCPAQTSNKVTCSSCGLCQVTKRKYIIGFRVHGRSKKKAKIAIGLTA